ncbi:MAG: hypothetical protein HYZ74_08435, partial [Elusimicrobia bacterium]|nr:hypothetical protein [Elusimicrobiota bacterium]
CARLAADLKTLSPAPERPRLAAPVALLSALLLGAGGAAMWSARAVYEAYASGALSLKAPDADTASSLLNALQGKGNEEDMRRAMEYAIALSSGMAR